MDYVDSLLIMEDDNDEPEGSFSAHNQDLAASGGSGDVSQSEPTPDWCKCRHCQPMSQEVENKCCGNRTCVTTKWCFAKLVLDPEVLELCIRNRADIRNDRQDTSTSSIRKAAYRQFILDKYKYLGKGNRKVAPSCVVLRIQKQYPSPTGMYLGFRPE